MNGHRSSFPRCIKTIETANISEEEMSKKTYNFHYVYNLKNYAIFIINYYVH